MKAARALQMSERWHPPAQDSLKMTLVCDVRDFLIQWLPKPNGPQDAHGHSLSPLAVCYAAVSACQCASGFQPPCHVSGAGADISADVSPGGSIP